MSEKCIIGIDSGAQSARAIMYDSKGVQVARGVADHPKMLFPHQGWARGKPNA